MTLLGVYITILFTEVYNNRQYQRQQREKNIELGLKTRPILVGKVNTNTKISKLLNKNHYFLLMDSNNEYLDNTIPHLSSDVIEFQNQGNSEIKKIDIIINKCHCIKLILKTSNFKYMLVI